MEQINSVSYCASTFFKTPAVEAAARILVDSTGGHMTRAYIVNSGQSDRYCLPTEHMTDQQQDRRRWKRQ